MAAKSTTVRSVSRTTTNPSGRSRSAGSKPGATRTRGRGVPVLFITGYRRRLGGRLRELRQKNRLTAYDIQNELARLGVFIPFWQLYALEDGRATFRVEDAPAFARVFGLPDVSSLFPPE